MTNARLTLTRSWKLVLLRGAGEGGEEGDEERGVGKRIGEGSPITGKQRLSSRLLSNIVISRDLLLYRCVEQRLCVPSQDMHA